MTAVIFIDIILYAICAINVLYLLIFALASIFNTHILKSVHKASTKQRKIVCLIPAYKEDTVIIESARACLEQTYNKADFDVVVIADKMSDATNSTLREMGAEVFVANYQDSTKAKALNLAFNSLPPDKYEIAIILDADNIVPENFLQEINRTFEYGSYDAYQAHRVAKNINNDMAYLDAISEEINNSIFRKGHINLGFSSALIGSGMAFNYNTIKTELSQMKAVGGFDRELEFRLFSQGLKIGYINDLLVYDEKVQSLSGFSNQRRRWMSAQFHYLKEFNGLFYTELFKGHFDFCDKLIQHLTLPRLLLLGVLFIISAITFVFVNPLSAKWVSLFALNIFVLAISVPRKLYSWRLLKAAMGIPRTFVIMFVNLFKLKGANKKFIHTSHGVDDGKTKN